MKDTGVGRNYSGLKLACWLSYGSYWEDTLRTLQVDNLVSRTLNHPEIDARWPKLQEIDVRFPVRGTTAWAERKRGGKGILSLPVGTRNPLIVLHEIAHLLNTTKPEPDHGPGFSAIHLMLVELMSPKDLPALIAAYQATHTKYDPSLIPEPSISSNYIPIVGGAPLQASLTYLRALVASGALTPAERTKTLEALKRMNTKEMKEMKETNTPRPLPVDIRIPTAALLRCNNSKQIASLVLNELKSEVMPGRMRPPAKPKKKGK